MVYATYSYYGGVFLSSARILNKKLQRGTNEEQRNKTANCKEIGLIRNNFISSNALKYFN